MQIYFFLPIVHNHFLCTPYHLKNSVDDVITIDVLVMCFWSKEHLNLCGIFQKFFILCVIKFLGTFRDSKQKAHDGIQRLLCPMYG